MLMHSSYCGLVHNHRCRVQNSFSPSVCPGEPWWAAVQCGGWLRAHAAGHGWLGTMLDCGSAPRRPWWVATCWADGEAWRGLAGHSEGAQHSGPSLTLGVGWWDGGGHRQQVLWCPRGRQLGGWYAPGPRYHPPGILSPVTYRTAHTKWPRQIAGFFI